MSVFFVEEHVPAGILHHRMRQNFSVGKNQMDVIIRFSLVMMQSSATLCAVFTAKLFREELQ